MLSDTDRLGEAWTWAWVTGRNRTHVESWDEMTTMLWLQEVRGLGSAEFSPLLHRLSFNGSFLLHNVTDEWMIEKGVRQRPRYVILRALSKLRHFAGVTLPDPHPWNSAYELLLESFDRAGYEGIQPDRYYRLSQKVHKWGFAEATTYPASIDELQIWLEEARGRYNLWKDRDWCKKYTHFMLRKVMEKQEPLSAQLADYKRVWYDTGLALTAADDEAYAARQPGAKQEL